MLLSIELTLDILKNEFIVRKLAILLVMLTHSLEQFGVARELKVFGLDQIDDLEIEVPIGLE